MYIEIRCFHPGAYGPSRVSVNITRFEKTQTYKFSMIEKPWQAMQIHETGASLFAGMCPIVPGVRS